LIRPKDDDESDGGDGIVVVFGSSLLRGVVVAFSSLSENGRGDEASK
jgi:hypothetical protein